MKKYYCLDCKKEVSDYRANKNRKFWKQFYTKLLEK